MNIPLSKPYIGKEEERAAAAVLRSGWLIHGPKNEEFEEKFARLVGVKYAISVNSCASALHLAVEAHGIKGEVLVPSFTHMASANAILRAGARPVFVDIDYDTCMLDSARIEESITPKTEAIMVVHFGGQCADMTALQKICRKHKLVLIEDSAETLGGTWNGKQAGSFGTGCFSFFPTKNITTAEGGMVTTNDPAVAERARVIAGHGVASSFLSREKQKKFWVREAVALGLNYRMSNMQAAIGVEQLKKLARMNRLRRGHAALLTSLLKDVEGVGLPVQQKGAHHVWQMYTIKVSPAIRDRVVAALRAQGIGASVHFDPPVHTQPFYKKNTYRRGSLSVTEEVSSSIITLPMYPGLGEKEVRAIAHGVKSALKSVS